LGMTLCCALSLFMALSCGRSESKSPTTKTSGSSHVRIVYIPKNTGNPYFDPLIEGFRKAAGECGAEFDSVAPATADPTSQLPLIKDQIQRGVTVLAISPNSPDALNTAFREAMNR